MAFSTDKQTLDDLAIFSKKGGDSIYAIFNRTTTRGGAAWLEEIFRRPLSDQQAINHRSGIIHYFAARQPAFPFKSALFDAIESYLANTDERTRLAADPALGKRLGNLLARDVQTELIYKGVAALLELLHEANTFVSALPAGTPYETERAAWAALLAAPVFATVQTTDGSKVSDAAMAGFDQHFRFGHRPVIQTLLRLAYELDVYMAVAHVASERNFSFPKALPNENLVLTLEGVYHPGVKNAVPNTLSITAANNVVFLTGANMAGKSTLMKSVSIALFLAHLGCPVPAAHMEFSVLDGIFTTINLPDNLGMGASHFYAEVLRLKKIAQELALGKHLFVLFDELFRGTNVKDAHQATVTITSAFAQRRNSLFVLSTHIIEAGDELKKTCDNIFFVYLPTRMDGHRPAYTYTLQPGITADRHGMVIIQNEGILDLLTANPGTTANAGNTNDATFIVDRQTLEDLNIPGRHRPNAIIGIFYQVKTHLGERLLESMFQKPLTDPAQINARTELLQYFQHKNLLFPCDSGSVYLVDNYIGLRADSNPLANAAGVLRKKALSALLHDPQYETLCREQAATLETLTALYTFIRQLQADHNSPYRERIGKLMQFFSTAAVQAMLRENTPRELSVAKVVKYDYLLRIRFRAALQEIIHDLAVIDVYIAVSTVARVRNFCYARAYPKTVATLRMTALRHPAHGKGVNNSLSFDQQENTLFLTGANMAGKSTLMKSVGIAVYLAHLGFPVAAESMEFSVKDGLYSSINVADNLHQGYSHFYAEVQRVKTVAQQVSRGLDLVVIFDELFKGTNVKDAYDATLAVTKSFSAYRRCCFVVSTHIIEVGDALQADGKHIRFAYMPTVMDGNVPRYTYRLTPGITRDRHGVMIIENEKILSFI